MHVARCRVVTRRNCAGSTRRPTRGRCRASGRQLRIGHLQHHLGLGLALDHVHAWRRNENFTPCSIVRLPTSFRFFARIFAFAALRFSGQTAAEIAFNASHRQKDANVALLRGCWERACSLSYRNTLRRCNRGNTYARLVEQLLKDLRGLLEIALDLVRPMARFPWNPKRAAILMHGSGCGFKGVNIWLLSDQRNLSCGQREHSRRRRKDSETAAINARRSIMWLSFSLIDDGRSTMDDRRSVRICRFVSARPLFVSSTLVPCVTINTGLEHDSRSSIRAEGSGNILCAFIAS